MPVQLITPPALEPLTVQEGKDHLRLETADDDASVTAFLLAARMYIEEITWCGLVTQVWELVEPHFPTDVLTAGSLGFPYSPADYSPYSPYEYPYTTTARNQYRQQLGFELPKGKLVSVASVKYIDTAGVQQTLAANTDYVVDTVSLPGRVRLAYGKSWPDHRAQWDAIRIQYTVGWAVAAVPQPLKQAMLLLLGHFYENRGLELPGRLTPLQFAVDALVSPYRLARHL